MEGIVWLRVKLGQTQRDVKFLVAHVTDQAILGMPALCEMECTLNFGKRLLECQGLEIPCFSVEGEMVSCRVAVWETVNIPPRTEFLIKAHVKTGEAPRCLCVVDQDSCFLERSGLVLAKGLVDPMQTAFALQVCNPLDEVMVLHKGMLIGTLTPVEIVESPSSGNMGEGLCRRLSNREDGTPDLPEHLQELYGRAVEFVPEADRGLIQAMLFEYRDVFSRDDRDIGRTDLVQHHVDTGDAKPIKQSPRRLPPGHRRELEKQVLDLLDRGLIEPSDSPWASPIVMVKKADGSLRLCIDLRRVNECGVGSGMPLPNTGELLSNLAGSVWFSTLDMLSGYWQMELDPESRPKTAFATHLGLHQWRVMPFGLSGAPGSFQKLMQIVLGSMSYEKLLVYLDDVIVPAKSVLEGVERLSEVFRRFRKANLKLKPRKCALFQPKVAFLGHVVSSEGIATDPSKVESVKTWPIPKNKSEVRSFLGLASYYRKYIKGFAHISFPLNRMTDKKSEFVWTEQCQAAFEHLKALLTQAPILAHPRDEGEYMLDTDASGVGIGGVLSQVQDGVERVIAYSSKSLTAAERNYCVTRRELWAMVYHVKHFRCFLYGRHFTIRTDHGSLKWLHRFKEPTGQLARWLDVLAEYDYTITCRPGVQHRNADALSRRPCDGKGCLCPILEGRDKISVGVQTGERHDVVRVIGESEEAENEGNQEVGTWDNEAMRTAQREDKSVGPVYKLLEDSEEKPTWEQVSHWSQESKTLITGWSSLCLKDGLLYYRWVGENCRESERLKLVVPEGFRDVILEQLHDSRTGAHLGVSKVYEKVKARYYWPGMSRYVKWWVSSCLTCQRFKDPGRKARGNLHQYIVGVPFERIAMDIVGPLPQSDQGNIYVLVICDYFTKYVEAFALPDQQAETVAMAFLEGWVTRLGVPRELHTDRGSNFESEVFTTMCRVLGIQKTRTTARNPKSDGLVERQNKTLEKLLAMVCAKHQFDWDEHIPYVLMAYRSSVHDSTQETPNLLCFGREISLPLDAATPPCPGEVPLAVPNFVLSVQARMREAHEVARQALQKSAVRQKRGYMTRFHENDFQVKDVVWYFFVENRRGKTPKFSPRWTGPFVIVQVISDVLFKIQTGPKALAKVVHHDHLKPCHLREPMDVSWVDSLSLSPSPNEPCISENSQESPQVIVRPKRSRRPPERFGDWNCEH